jgi:uncharacterized protein (UPF0332 family)
MSSMAFGWRLYLRLAESLAEMEAEALQRTAATRAYYAIFNLCRSWLESHHVAFRGESVHRHLWHAFATARHATSASATDWREIAGIGRTLNRLRKECDYDPVVADLARRTNEAVVGARRVVDELLPRLEIA